MSQVWRPAACGISVSIKVQPKAKRVGLQGIAMSADGPRLRIGVNEAAEAGKANRAASAILADALGVAASAVTVAIGASSREKVMHVTGDQAILAAKLDAM